MTDQQLAQNLVDAERDGDNDNIAYYENEILARLNVPLDHTERGLTKEAATAIDRFCQNNGVE